VPDGVGVAHTVVQHKKHHAQRVGHAPSQQPSQPFQGDALEQGHGGYQHQPTHGQVQAGGPPGVRQAVKGLERYAGSGQRPHHAKQRPAPEPVERDQRKRRVAAGNKQVNRAVVELHEHALGATGGQGVVQGRRQVQKHHGDAKHHRTHHCQRVAMTGRRHQKWQCGQRSQERHRMAYCVGNFFTQGLVAFGQVAMVRRAYVAAVTHRKWGPLLRPALRCHTVIPKATEILS